MAALENQITERYRLLLSQTQLAELLGRTPGGLRYSLSYPCDAHTRPPGGLRAQDRPARLTRPPRSPGSSPGEV